MSVVHGARRGRWIPWYWPYRWYGLSCVCWKSNSGPLQDLAICMHSLQPSYAQVPNTDSVLVGPSLIHIQLAESMSLDHETLWLFLGPMLTHILIVTHTYITYICQLYLYITDALGIRKQNL